MEVRGIHETHARARRTGTTSYRQTGSKRTIQTEIAEANRKEKKQVSKKLKKTQNFFIFSQIKMSLHQIGSDLRYVLPAYHDAVPEQFKSDSCPKPFPCSVQTVNIPSLSGDQAPSGTTILQIPCGSNAGFMMNPYIRFTLLTTQTSAAGSSFNFKGAVGAATACINRLSTYVNSVQVDNIQNADQVYDQLFAHSTSADFCAHDLTVLAGAQQYVNTSNSTTTTNTYVIPLIGLLGSLNALPLFLINGSLMIQIDWNSIARAIYPGATDPVVSNFAFKNVQIVYDRVQPEQMFIDSVKSSMASGHKFVYSYTNYQSTVLPIQGGTQTLNYGLNVSSLRGLIATQVLTTDLSTYGPTAKGYSLANGQTLFQVSLDGRLINNNPLDTTQYPAIVFAEMSKSQSRVFDASVTDLVGNCVVNTSGTPAVASISYLTQAFATGVSCTRTTEALSFAGSPVSIVTVQQNNSGSSGYSMFLTYISDYQLLVDHTGSVEIVR
jgi:hypothetical protein